jgi:hypothetical protein
MGRKSGPRGAVCSAIVAVMAALVATLAVRARAASSDCANSAFACGDSVCGTGDGLFCGQLVTPKGGCPSGEEMFWFDARYMLWQRDGFALPALATTSTNPVDAGILGQPTTSVLAGDNFVSDHVRSGFGLEFGYWLDPLTDWGVAGDFFNAGRDSYGVVLGPDDEQLIARPFLNAQTGLQNSRPINVPDELVGVLTVAAFDDFHGAGAWMQRCVWFTGNGCTGAGTARLNVLGGYRYYHQDSLVFIREDFAALAGNTDGFATGFEHHAFDKFAGRNEFHGAEIGLQGRMQQCRWWCEGLAAVAVGPTRHVVFVEGASISDEPNLPPVLDGNGNLLTSDVTNVGRYVDDEWQAIPRFRLGAGWQVTEWLGVELGYNLVVWDIVHAADGFPPDLAVDVRNLPAVTTPGGAEPAFPGLRERTMVAHGLDLGLEVTF